MNEREDCCGEEVSDKDCACDSTFISYLPEPEHDIDILPFDNTLDNMDVDWAAPDMAPTPTNILKRAYNRSRLYSEVEP